MVYYPAYIKNYLKKMAERYLTVQQLNYFISDIFLREELLHNVPVAGEVSGCALRGGNCYFTLKDAYAQISVCFFGYAKDAYIPVDGEQVLIYGGVDFYMKRGTVCLKTYRIEPLGGKGILHVKLEQLKEKLQKEGLFEERYKKEIPARPKNVAVITSVKGAAFQDFFTTVKKKNDIVNLTVIDVRVQGNYCAGDCITALKNADEIGYDVIVLTRGGGSFEDLYAFNDEELVRTVFEMNTPVISAIGHETDYTLCDFVADRRAMTPTAAGQMIGYDVGLIKNEILDLTDEIAVAVKNNYLNIKSKLVYGINNIKSKSEMLHVQQINNIRKAQLIMSNIMNSKYLNKQSNVRIYMEKLEGLSPVKLLDKGYFKLYKENKIFNRIKELELGDEINIYGIDGKAMAKITGKELTVK